LLAGRSTPRSKSKPQQLGSPFSSAHVHAWQCNPTEFFVLQAHTTAFVLRGALLRDSHKTAFSRVWMQGGK
jgi:hypothetical protein